ncbi:MAG: AsnC family transcriptional regulator [Fibrobacter sp.]|nr:AsnC family transcriptional regulator [Fibrobacter sp.]
MDTLDRKILDILQKRFPLCVNPWNAVAGELDITENEVLRRIGTLKNDGVIRQISPIFDSSKIGYHSTLCAFKVPSDRVEQTASVLGEHSGISHCYLRDNSYNIWFTLTLEKKFSLSDELFALAQKTSVDSWLDLPAAKVYKISFTLDMSRKAEKCDKNNSVEETIGELPIDKKFIREVQHDLPVKHDPFEEIAFKLGCTQQAIVDKLESCMRTGQIRRFAAILRPLNAGFINNILVAWNPLPCDADTLGNYAASHSHVSHCYLRQPQPDWPYSVYTMIHGEGEKNCRDIICDIAENTKTSEYCTLKTCKEFKKVRVVYYS